MIMSLLKRSQADKPKPDLDAIEFLKKDHRVVSQLLDRFEEADGRGKRSIAAQICHALEVHAQIEEEIFYPAARSALQKEEQDLIDEADVEHATVKGLVGRIQSVRPSDDHFEALVTVLGEYVKHHVNEEENELFPKLKTTEMNLEAVGSALALRKSELENKASKLSSSPR
jgi:hemerythrin superfamily protein